MKRLSIGEAARLTGKSKSTISRAVKSGRISAARDGNRVLIDPSELARVFDATVAQPLQSNDAQPPATTPRHPTSDALETEIRMLREMLDRERETVDDLRQRLTRAQAVIEDHRQKPARRSWWPWS